MVSLEPIGDDCKQQMPRQMSRRRSPKDTLPARAQSTEIETAQMRDLVLNRCFGGAGNRKGDLGEAVIGLAVPGKPSDITITRCRGTRRPWGRHNHML